MPRKEIKKPNAIMMSIFGVMSPKSFKTDKLNAAVRSNIKAYIEEKWGEGDLWDSIVAMKLEAEHDAKSRRQKSAIIANNCETDQKIKETVIAYVLQRLDEAQEDIKPHNRHLQTFVTLLWKYAFSKGTLKTDLFEDVVSVLSKWNKEGIKLYTISTLNSSTVKCIVSNTTNGDISNVIELCANNSKLGNQLFTEHVSTDGNYKEACEHVGEHASSCFYIVENIAEARTIMSVGAKCALMNRNAKLFSETEVAELSVINSFEDIVFVE